HSFAQWIEVLADGTAVWNRGDGKQVPFAQYWQGNQGPYWRAEDSYHTLTSSGHADSPTLIYEDDSTCVTVPYGSFVLKDGAQTQYFFTQVRWHLADHPPNGDGFAIPYFLLTQVRDRWGRVINVTWNDYGVATVRDGNNRGLTFNYSGALIASVTD